MSLKWHFENIFFYINIHYKRRISRTFYQSLGQSDQATGLKVLIFSSVDGEGKGLTT